MIQITIPVSKMEDKEATTHRNLHSSEVSDHETDANHKSDIVETIKDLYIKSKVSMVTKTVRKNFFGKIEKERSWHQSGRK